MYLSRDGILAILDQLAVNTHDQVLPFNPQTQVQPASLDLRLSNVFWEKNAELGRSTIDFRSHKLEENSPRRLWRKRVLAESESIKLMPMKTINARTHERFKMPSALCGVLYGRSSFSRLGLAITQNGTFINPGWEGHFPLQLTNLGPYPIVLLPYIGICQLCFVSLSSTPSLSYGSPELGSKYAQDDGGPSLWWRDNSVKDAASAMKRRDVTAGSREIIESYLATKDLTVLDRFNKCLARIPVGDFSISTALVSFLHSEKRLIWRYNAGKLASSIIALLVGGIVTTFLYDKGLSLRPNEVIISILCLAVVAGGLWHATFSQPPVFLNKAEEEELLKAVENAS